MSRTTFYASIEGAQHGAKSLDEFLKFAKNSGASGAQPSNYLVQDGNGLMSAAKVKEAFDKYELHLDGISSHCITWVLGTAWTGSKTVRPFVPENVWRKSTADIEAWAEDYMLRLLDLLAELNVKITPMFWGLSYGLEVGTGYPFGFFQGPGYDLIKEGHERFRDQTKRIREKANEHGIYLAHEIHPNTAGSTADDFLDMVDACGGDKCLAVNADPSHCWEGEDWETRFRKVGSRVVAAHVKNFVVRPGFPLRSMKGRWQDRAMQFVDLGSGDINLMRYTEMLIDIGYPTRYCEIMGRKQAPLVVEAESAYRDLDACSADGIAYVRDNLCWPVAAGSFEDGMGA